jgi:hypothetical protein
MIPGLWRGAPRLAARKGWSVEDLCERAGYDRYFLSKPAGYGRRIDCVIALARTAGVSLEWLAGVSLSDAVDPTTELARLATVANVATHLYFALRSQPSNADDEAIIRSTLAALGQERPQRAAEEQPEAIERQEPGAAPTTADAQGSRRRRTSRVHSTSP